MKFLSNPDHLKPHWLILILLTSLIFLTGATWYFTPNPESRPVAKNATFAPFLDIVPSQDGTEIFISAGTAEVGGTVFANVNVGGGNRKGHTLAYSDTVQAYLTTPIDPVTGFTPGVSENNNKLSITTTLGLDTGPVEFNRAYLSKTPALPIYSNDGKLKLELLQTNTITGDTYIVIVPSFSPPGPASEGRSFVGSVYSVRTPNVLVANEPMILDLFYTEETLAGADPETLAIFAWDAFFKRWDNLGGNHFISQKSVSVATSRFTTYALMSAVDVKKIYLPVVAK